MCSKLKMLFWSVGPCCGAGALQAAGKEGPGQVSCLLLINVLLSSCIYLQIYSINKSLMM